MREREREVEAEAAEGLWTAERVRVRHLTGIINQETPGRRRGGGHATSRPPRHTSCRQSERDRGNGEESYVYANTEPITYVV